MYWFDLVDWIGNEKKKRFGECNKISQKNGAEGINEYINFHLIKKIDEWDRVTWRLNIGVKIFHLTFDGNSNGI